MDWHHAPVHRLEQRGAYMVTAATYQKESLFVGNDWLDFIQNQLFEICHEFNWNLQAWAIFPNHYHIVAISPDNGKTLIPMLRKLHACSARELNRRDGVPGRKVWHNYWDTFLSFHRSYIARLNYVHQNPVHHGLVQNASAYEWCSASWFERTAEPSFRKTVNSFKTDRVKVIDLF